jgi:isoleucyl-tRNA synthetase
VEDLANCYVKLNRDRLKGKLGLDEWVESLSVLYYALIQYAKILAPFAPFLAEYVYQHISNLDESNPESVMLVNFPITEEKNEYTTTFNLMKRILKIVRSERFKTKTHSSLKTPIVLCEILMNSEKDLLELESLITLIQSELNCLEFKFGRFDRETELKIELVLSEIGKKYKKDAQKIKQKCTELSQEEIKTSLENNYLEFFIGDIEYKLLQNEFTIKVEPKKSDNDKLVSVIDSELMCRLDFTFNDQIIHRSIANALVTDVQRQRKEMGLRPWNKIVLHITSDEKLVLNSDLLNLIEKRIENKVEYLGNFNFNESGNSNKIKKYFNEDFNIEINYLIEVLNWN